MVDHSRPGRSVTPPSCDLHACCAWASAATGVLDEVYDVVGMFLA